MKAIIFDFGNVLLRWDPRRLFQHHFPAGPQAVDAFMAEIGFVDWHLEQDRGRPFAEAIAERTAKFPQYTHILADYDSHYMNAVVEAIAGSVEILAKLKQAGYSLYGLSNYPTEKFVLTREKYPFFDWFDAIVISGEVRLLKPDPAIFNLLLAKIGQPPEECVFIDDLATNVNAARQLGMSAIQFHSPEQLASELEKLEILPIRSHTP